MGMDAENFKRKFLSFHPKLFRIAYALVENKADAEDILQDAYFKLWNKRDELPDIENPEAFCVTLVKNLSLDFLRSPRANRREEEIESVFTLATDSSPEKELETKDKEQQIRQLINRLPENQRQVLRLRGIDDCSMDEIEQITGLNAVNVRVLLSRARKVIREQFEKLYEYEQGPPGGSNVTGRTFRTVGAADRCLGRRRKEGDDPFIFPPPFSLLAQRSRCRSTVMHRHLPVYYPQ